MKFLNPYCRVFVKPCQGIGLKVMLSLVYGRFLSLVYIRHIPVNDLEMQRYPWFYNITSVEVETNI